MTASPTRPGTRRARRAAPAHSAPRRPPGRRAPRRATARVPLAVLVVAVCVVALAGAVTAARLGAGPSTARPARDGVAKAGSVRAGSAGGSAGTGPATAAGGARAGTTPAGAERPGAGPAVLQNLSVAQLAGQRVIYSYSGLTPPASLLRLIRHGEAAGVIFFGGNIASKSQIAGVIKRLSLANASPGNPLHAVPLLLMTDQEGGLVRRLPGPPVLSEKQIGQSAQPAAAAKKAGTGAGQNLASVGMNVNLAPVLDVYRTPGNFIDQFGRSYSMNPRKVSYLGADFITAQQAVGVAATGKHFPGLGAAATSQNTDLRPVTLNVSRHDLRTIDEFPYLAAIRHGVKLVMVSWAVYPALDRARPAGLSPTIVGGELRQRLGFTGVTITDALGAGALQAFGTIPHRAVLAAGAGMDLILCARQHVDEGARARTALAAAYSGGTLDQTAFRAAVQRVIALRTSLAG